MQLEQRSEHYILLSFFSSNWHYRAGHSGRLASRVATPASEMFASTLNRLINRHSEDLAIQTISSDLKTEQSLWFLRTISLIRVASKYDKEFALENFIFFFNNWNAVTASLGFYRVCVVLYLMLAILGPRYFCGPGFLFFLQWQDLGG